VVNPWRRESDVGANAGRNIRQPCGIETVFEGEDRLSGAVRGSAPSEFIKMPLKPIVPLDERHLVASQWVEQK
jgi:hypothetical protein